MPKKALKIDRFEKGMLTLYDKRDLPEGGLANATDVMVDIIGTIRQMGNSRDHYMSSNITAGILPGYGLFSFTSDYNNAGIEGEHDVLAVQQNSSDGAYIGIVDSTNHDQEIYLGQLDGYEGNLGNSDVNNCKPIFYYIDGALRVSDSTLSNVNNSSKWYGHLVGKVWFSGLTEQLAFDDLTAGTFWYTEEQALREAPRLDENMVKFNATIDCGDLNNGVGFHFNKTTDNGSWVQTTGMKLGWTWLYEPGLNGIDDFTQESTMNKRNMVQAGGAESATVSLVANDSLDITILVDPNSADFKSHCFDKRIIGCRIYMLGTSTLTYDDPYMLAEAYFGRSDTDKAFIRSHDGVVSDFINGTSSNSQISAGTAALATVSVKDIPALTYSLLNTYPHDSKTTSANYATVAIINRRAYIGNIRRKTSYGYSSGSNAATDHTNIQYAPQHDRIIKSPVNRFDIFPETNFIDVATDDGDVIVKLVAFGDKLMQFKKKSLYILNVSGDVEYLENKYKHMGVASPYAVTEFEGGVAWVNTNGCFLYSGEKVINVVDNKLDSGKVSGNVYSEPEGWSTFVGQTGMIGYLPQLKQILVMQDPGLADQNGVVMIYDITTQSWTRGIDRISRVGKSNLVNYKDKLTYLTMDEGSSGEVGNHVVFISPQVPDDWEWGCNVEDGFGNCLPGGWEANAYGVNPAFNHTWDLTEASIVKIGTTVIGNLEAYSVYQPAMYDTAHLGNYIKQQIESYTASENRPLTCIIESDRFRVLRKGKDVDGTYTALVSGAQQNLSFTHPPSINGAAVNATTIPISHGSIIANTTLDKPAVSLGWSRNFTQADSGPWSTGNPLSFRFEIDFTNNNMVTSAGDHFFCPPPWLHLFSINFDSNGNNIFDATPTDISDADLERNHPRTTPNVHMGYDPNRYKGSISIQANDTNGYSQIYSTLSGVTDEDSVGAWNFRGGASGDDSSPFKMPLIVKDDGYHTDNIYAPFPRLARYNVYVGSYDSRRDNVSDAGDYSRTWNQDYSHKGCVPEMSPNLMYHFPGVIYQQEANNENHEHWNTHKSIIFNGAQDQSSDSHRWTTESDNWSPDSGIFNTASNDMELRSNNILILSEPDEASAFIAFPGKCLQGAIQGTKVSLSGLSNSDFNFPTGATKGDIPLANIHVDEIDFKYPGSVPPSSHWEVTGGMQVNPEYDYNEVVTYVTWIYLDESSCTHADQITFLTQLKNASFLEEYTIQSGGTPMNFYKNMGVYQGQAQESHLKINRNPSAVGDEYIAGVTYYTTVNGMDGRGYTVENITSTGEDAYQLSESILGSIRNLVDVNNADTYLDIQPWASDGRVELQDLTLVHSQVASANTRITITDPNSTNTPLSVPPGVVQHDLTRFISNGDTIVLESADYTSGAQKYYVQNVNFTSNTTVIDIDAGASPDGAFAYSSGTKTGVNIKTSTLKFIGNIPDDETVDNPISVYSIVYQDLALKYFDNSTKHSNSADAGSNSICVETKDIDFGMAGVYKIGYKVSVSMKGVGYVKLQYALDGSNNYNDMVTGELTNNLFLNSADWNTYTFDFGGYLENTTNTNVLEPGLDRSVKDIYSIRFRIKSDSAAGVASGVSGFGINDFTFIYRIKGIY